MFLHQDSKLSCEVLSTAQMESNFSSIVNTGDFMLFCMHNVTSKRLGLSSWISFNLLLQIPQELKTMKHRLSED